MDGDAGLAHALGTASRVAVTLSRGHRSLVIHSVAASAVPTAPAPAPATKPAPYPCSVITSPSANDPRPRPR